MMTAASFATLAQPEASIHDVRIVIVGHVDHGKSTLVGRLLYDTKALPDGKYEQIKASCARRGMAFEWAFLMDALQAERDQNVTIDTTQIWFSSAQRRYCLIDAPGHREFVKNMITGAASADAALLLVDAQEGLQEQTKRHAYLLHLLGIRQVIVVVNKMDAVGYSQSVFEAVQKDVAAYLTPLGIEPLAYTPISAREGEGVATASQAMTWAPLSLLALLDQLSAPLADESAPLRFAVQDVYKVDNDRVIAGRIESGTLNVGDNLLFSPTNEAAMVKAFASWPPGQSKTQASAGESIGVMLEQKIFVERGHLASHEHDAPILTNQITARIFWIADAPLARGKRYKLKLASAHYHVDIAQISRVIDTDTLSHSDAAQLFRLQVGEVVLNVKGFAAIDDHQALPRTGRFVLFDGYKVAGGGIISAEHTHDLRQVTRKAIKSENITQVDFEITRDDRARQNHHRGGVLWLTGLSGSGKSTLAKELQKRLFAKGYQTYVLDGDNVRHGLCSDLGFAPEDRQENIRRVGEVANLFADAGFIVITAFISPYTEDRRRARATAPGYFHAVYVKASVEACESRDVKGLYKKARAGEIKDFTGISAPYEEPESPDLVVDTEGAAVGESVEELLHYVEKQFAL